MNQFGEGGAVLEKNNDLISKFPNLQISKLECCKFTKSEAFFKAFVFSLNYI